MENDTAAIVLKRLTVDQNPKVRETVRKVDGIVNFIESSLNDYLVFIKANKHEFKLNDFYGFIRPKLLITYYVPPKYTLNTPVNRQAMMAVKS